MKEVDLSTSLYSVGFPPTHLLFAAKSSSTRSFIAVGESQNHRITEWYGLEGTSVGHVVQPSC